jgi:hypothetical protein
MVKAGNARRRALCAAVAAALLLAAMTSLTLRAQVEGERAYKPPPSPAPVDGERGQKPPPSPAPVAGEGGQKPPPPRTASRGNEWVPWAIVGVIGAAAIAASAKDNNAHVDADMLAANGPRFPDSYSIGTFGVQGYVRGGWPVVIDFAAQPDTCTWLEISVDQRSFASVLDFDGRGERKLVRIDMPGALAPGPSPGMYVVHSARPACPNHRVPGNERTPSPVEVYGIGAGPRAVGSVAIDELQFGPPELRSPQDRATIAYRAESEFNHASIEILRFDQDPPGQFNVHRVTARKADVAAGQNQSAPWDGKTDSGARSLGVHRLQVRAWFTENDKSWVGAISPSSVIVAQ